MARTGPKASYTEEAEVMHVWKAALNDDTNNIDETEELEDFLIYPRGTAASLDTFAMRYYVIKMIVNETRKYGVAKVTEWIMGTAVSTITKAIQVECRSGKNGIEVPILRLVGEVLIDLV